MSSLAGVRRQCPFIGEKQLAALHLHVYGLIGNPHRGPFKWRPVGRDWRVLRDQPQGFRLAGPEPDRRSSASLYGEFRALSYDRTAIPEISLDRLADGGVSPRRSDAFGEVKLPWPAEIVEAVGDVAILLNLEQRQATSDGMQRARRRIIGISGLDRSPVEHLGD